MTEFHVERHHGYWEKVTADRVRFDAGTAIFENGSYLEPVFVCAVDRGQWSIVSSATRRAGEGE